MLLQLVLWLGVALAIAALLSLAGNVGQLARSLSGIARDLNELVKLEQRRDARTREILGEDNS